MSKHLSGLLIALTVSGAFVVGSSTPATAKVTHKTAYMCSKCKVSASKGDKCAHCKVSFRKDGSCPKCGGHLVHKRA